MKKLTITAGEFTRTLSIAALRTLRKAHESKTKGGYSVCDDRGFAACARGLERAGLVRVAEDRMGRVHFIVLTDEAHAIAAQYITERAARLALEQS